MFDSLQQRLRPPVGVRVAVRISPAHWSLRCEKTGAGSLKGQPSPHAVDFAWVSILDLPEEGSKSGAAIGPFCRKPPNEFGQL